MQKMNGEAATTPAFPLDSSTGPAAEATTGAGSAGSVGIEGENGEECSATVVLHVTHNKVIATATLNMGTTRVAQRVLERRRGIAAGWAVVKGGDFEDDAPRISNELAKVAACLPMPYALANMLPGRKATPAAIALAAQEVIRG